MKRILAIIGVALLVGLYISTLIFSMIGSEIATSLFKASIAMTILIPVLLFAFILIYKVLKANSPYAETPSVDSLSDTESATDESSDLTE